MREGKERGTVTRLCEFTLHFPHSLMCQAHTLPNKADFHFVKEITLLCKCVTGHYITLSYWNNFSSLSSPVISPLINYLF